MVASFFTLVRFACRDDADDIFVWFREHYEEELVAGTPDNAPSLLSGMALVDIHKSA
jgi:hypothetical protein